MILAERRELVFATNFFINLVLASETREADEITNNKQSKYSNFIA